MKLNEDIQQGRNIGSYVLKNIDYCLNLQSSNVVKVVFAGDPDPQTLLATTEQEQKVSGENPATVSGPVWERD